MDFALFMERYGYKILLMALIGGAVVFILSLLGYEMHSLGHYSWGEILFFVGVLIAASAVGVFAGRFMNTTLGLLSRLGYTSKAKFMEDEKRLEREREKLREEGETLY